jgi:sugar phosphate permease
VARPTGSASGWVAWAIPTGLFVIAFFHRPAPGIIARELMEAFGATGALIGLLSATYYYGYGGLTVPAGVLVDAFGVRRLVAAGGLVMGLGRLALAWAPTPAWLFTGRFLVGLGGSVTFVGGLKVAATWFPPSRFGMLAAMTATAGSLGGLLATVPLAALVGAVGWRRAFVLVGLVALAGGVACLVWVRDHPGPAGPPAPGAGLRAVLAGAGRVLANPHTWPPCLALLFLVGASSNLGLWVVPYLRDVYGLTTTRAAFYATGSTLATLVAGPLIGWLSDRVLRRRRRPYVVLTAVLLALWVVFLATLGRLTLGGAYLLFFAMGAAGSAFVLTWPIGREVNPAPLAGVAVAVVNAGGLLGAALTQGPIGALLDARWAGAMASGARVYPVEAYRAAFAACAGMAVAAALIGGLLRETRGENVYRRRVIDS